MDPKLVESTVDAVYRPAIGGSISTEGLIGYVRKEEEIAKLLSQGTPAAELVHQGYSRGPVYKVARCLAEGGTSNQQHLAGPEPDATDPVADSAVEADPEILALKKALRKAQLDRQLAEIRAPIDLETRLAKIEEEVAVLVASIGHLNQQARGSLLVEIRQRFECSCGANGLVAAKLRCTACGSESDYGWWPKGSK